MGHSTHEIIHTMTQMLYRGNLTPEALRNDITKLAYSVRTVADMLDMFIKLELENEAARTNQATTELPDNTGRAGD